MMPIRRSWLSVLLFKRTRAHSVRAYTHFDLGSESVVPHGVSPSGRPLGPSGLPFFAVVAQPYRLALLALWLLRPAVIYQLGVLTTFSEQTLLISLVCLCAQYHRGDSSCYAWCPRTALPLTGFSYSWWHCLAYSPPHLHRPLPLRPPLLLRQLLVRRLICGWASCEVLSFLPRAARTHSGAGGLLPGPGDHREVPGFGRCCGDWLSYLHYRPSESLVR